MEITDAMRDAMTSTVLNYWNSMNDVDLDSISPEMFIEAATFALDAALAVAVSEPAGESLDDILAEIEAMDHDWLIDSISDDDDNRVYRACGFKSGWKSGDLEFTRHFKLTAAIALRDAIRQQTGTTIEGVGPRSLPDRCPSGHAFTSENTRTTNRGHRVCRACEREYNLRRKHQ